ncbi:MAG: putative hydroxymethylpyrimidine transport system permease protein [Solirubrobacteraceae bacterium]|jgi:putative hydroxymethylpyrimidine transport system permease protein|nr:putative hydroxymethylpyrimidine transport system permease protein [Solirubrobacteraceae bacterium]
MIRRAWPPLLVLAVLLGAWEIYVDAGGVDDLILASPSQVATALWDDRSLLADNLWVTAQEVGLGIVLALAGGLLLAVVIHVSEILRRALYPLLVGSQAVPLVILAPLLVYWVGFGILPKLVIIGLICFFPVVVTTFDGLRAIDPELGKLMTTLGATRWQAFRITELPAALPAALSGARIAVAIAVIGAVLAESAGSTSGLGHLMLQAIPNLETARAYAAVAVLAAFAIALFYALGVAERRLLSYRTRSS